MRAFTSFKTREGSALPADCVNNYNVKGKFLKKGSTESELVMWLGSTDSWHLKLEKAQQNQVCKTFGRANHINDISGQGIRNLKRCASMQDDIEQGTYM
jgi:hypothetical protein